MANLFRVVDDSPWRAQLVGVDTVIDLQLGQASGGVDLAPAQQAVAVLGDLLALTPATEFIAAYATLMGARG